MSLYIMRARAVFPKRKGRGQIVLNEIESVRIESSWKNLTDTAELTLPRKVLKKTFDKKRVRDIFTKGDYVRIDLGYYDAQDKRKGLRREFEGYVTEVSAGMPIRLKLEDEMWKLKQIPVNYASSNVSLKDMLKEILPKYNIQADDKEQLGKVSYPDTTAAEVLKKLQHEKYIYSWFKGGILFSGKVYAKDIRVPAHTFHLERNAVSNRLQYRRAEDMKVLIIAVVMCLGKKKECRVGELGGQVYKLHYTSDDWMTEAILKEKVQHEYELKKSDGLEGSFTAFGKPSVRHSEKVNLRSKIYEDRNGLYYIEGVIKSFNQQGYRQEIRLGNKVKK